MWYSKDGFEQDHRCLVILMTGSIVCCYKYLKGKEAQCSMTHMEQ